MEKNYIMYKKGYKHMLDDLEHAKRNLKGFRRGLSIYEDQTLRKQLTEETAAPVLSNPALSDKLQHVIFSDANLGYGPKQSIIQNYAKDYDEEGVEFREHDITMLDSTFYRTRENSTVHTNKTASPSKNNDKRFRHTHTSGFG
jgi:hypothetical protein